MEAAAASSSKAEGKEKKVKEDKEFVYERQVDDEATLEEEEKLEQANVQVCAVHTPHRVD